MALKNSLTKGMAIGLVGGTVASGDPFKALDIAKQYFTSDAKAWTGAVKSNKAWTGLGSGSEEDNPPGNPPGNPYIYGGGGYGAYGTGKSPEEVQKETQAQINNLGANSAARAGDLNQIAKDSLDTIKTQIQNNEDSYNYGMQQANMISAWQPNQQRETSTYRALRNRMGNAAYGSGLADLNEGMARVDDMNDVELINTYKENVSGLWDNYRNALTSLQADYAEQVNAIRDEFSKLSSQYWSSMSNINPLLATEENMGKAQNGETVTVGEGTDAYTLPNVDLRPSPELRELMVKLEAPNAFNPLTGNYVRPDNAVVQANRVGNTGRSNKASIAHREFGNEMDAYRRRV